MEILENRSFWNLFNRMVFIFAGFAPTMVYSQSPGSGKCLNFNGIDNYVDLGDIYDDLYPPFTISAWVFLDETAQGWSPIFVSQDNSTVYKGTVFLVSKSQIGIEYGDGRGWNNPQFRRSKGANVGNITNRWIHVAGIIRSATDMDLYINGLNVEGSYSGSSPYEMVNRAGDVAKIGAWYSNNQRFWFKGKIDELRVWNYSRSEEEIRNDMCRKLDGNESGLIGYWRLDEESGNVVEDYSVNKFNGELKNGVTRTTSGASLGDHSTYRYSNNFIGHSLSIGTDNDEDHLMLDDISDNSKGVQLYRVDGIPNDLSGIDNKKVTSPYYGLYVCNYSSEDIDYDIVINKGCSIYFRENNSYTPWKIMESNETNSFTIYNHTDRSEEIISLNGGELNLGPDRSICRGESILLEIKDFDYEKVEWSTGSTNKEVLIDDAGIVWAKVYSECGVTIDSINILLSQTPLISLGEDLMLCREQEVLLTVEKNKYDKITWQDGSSDSVFVAKSPGIYWIQVENQCGISYDSIKIDEKKYEEIFLPNVVTHNGDRLNDFFYIGEQIEKAALKIYNRWGREVYRSDDYKNEWPKGNISSGVYYYYLNDDCSKMEFKGTIHVIK